MRKESKRQGLSVENYEIFYFWKKNSTKASHQQFSVTLTGPEFKIIVSFLPEKGMRLHALPSSWTLFYTLWTTRYILKENNFETKQNFVLKQMFFPRQQMYSFPTSAKPQQW